MYYKNYILNYMDGCDNLTLVELDENISSEVSGDWILAHTKSLYSIPRNKVENYENFIERNGLFLGIFPKDLVKQDIINWKNMQEQFNQDIDDKIIENHTQILKEIDFKKMYDDNISLDLVLSILFNINERRQLYFNLSPIDIEREYKDYLIKYWEEEYGKSTK